MFFLCTLIILPLSNTTSADDPQNWIKFGGPTGDFRATANVPDSFTADSIVWRVPIGLGESSVIGDKNRLYTMTGERDANDITKGTESVIALNPKDGTVLWQYKYAVTGLPDGETPVKGGKSGPQASPCIVGDKVVTVGYTGHVSALDAATGKVVWEKELIKDFNAKSPEFGFASSPVPLGQLLLLPVGGLKGPAIVALDPANGTEKWRTGVDAASCATPQVVKLCGIEQVVHLSRNKLSGYSPNDGTELWSYKLPVAGQTNVPSPLILDGDRILISGQGLKGTRLLSVARNGTKYDVTEKWKTESEFFYCNWQVIDNILYGSCRSGFVAINLKDGETQWEDKKWKDANWLLVSGQPLILNRDGRLARCSFNADGVKETAGVPATSRSWALPSIIGDRMYLRSGKEIVAVKLK